MKNIRKAPFSRGINFTKWFEFRSVKDIQFNRIDEKDFEFAKNTGFEVIRLPIAMHNFTFGNADYTLDPVFFKYLDTAVDWAEKYKLFIIIDNHSFHPINPTDAGIDKILIPVWKQIAKQYKDRGDYVLYEILNEPHHIDDEKWGEIQGMAIDAIREIDKKHTIIAGGTDFNSIPKLDSIPAYKDDNIIYTFHFYDPFLFTHQGATWVKPSLSPLANIPFPADKNRMPELPVVFKDSWIENNYTNYEKEAAFENLLSKLDNAAAFSNKRGVPIFCGEFGVFMIQSPQNDRIEWYKFICKELEKRNIPWTSWDYFGGFGIFKTDQKGNLTDGVNWEVLNAMGLKPS